MNALLKRLRHCLQNFREARDGNVAVIFALATLPLVGFVGAAVDYSHANSIRAALQTSIDSTALMLSKQAASIDSTALQTKANSYFAALFTRPEATLVSLTPVYTNANGLSQLTVTAKVTMNTNFMKLVSVNTMEIGASSNVKWGFSRLRVALALDNTGSMQQSSKMTKLKTATKNLLTQLQAAATQDGDVYVSIIPFAQHVKASAPLKVNNVWTYPSWVRWDEFDEKNGSCNRSSRWNTYSTKSSCVAAGGTWTADDHSTWLGCVADRDKDYDVKNTAPNDMNTSTLFVAEQPDRPEYCPVAILPQTYNWTALNAKVDEMTPNGGTNQTIGMVWAWQSLSQTSPLNAPVKDANFTYSDVIILLSDGLNTINRWDGNGSSHSNAVDARMALACANAKNDKKIIYTVQVATDGDPQSTVLQNCASDSAKFFYLTNANAIVTTFETIGTNLSQLYIAK